MTLVTTTRQMLPIHAYRYSVLLIYKLELDLLLLPLYYHTMAHSSTLSCKRMVL